MLPATDDCPSHEGRRPREGGAVQSGEGLFCPARTVVAFHGPVDGHPGLTKLLRALAVVKTAGPHEFRIAGPITQESAWSDLLVAVLQANRWRSGLQVRYLGSLEGGALLEALRGAEVVFTPAEKGGLEYRLAGGRRGMLGPDADPTLIAELFDDTEAGSTAWT